MRTLRFIAPALLLASLTLAGTGCVSQGSLDDARTSNRALQERISDLENQLNAAKKELNNRDASASSTASLRAKYDELKAQYDELAKHKGDVMIGQLPQDLNAALTNLAKANPDLMTFDEATGMIRLKSDFTFALGSTDVNEKAEEAIKKLASVLNRNDASKYEVQIVGHTDNVPVTSASNKARFEDNWGLSAARAQSVLQVLRDGGVSESRMALVGYGEQKPVVPNPEVTAAGKKKGAAANRRVEIYLRQVGIVKSQQPTGIVKTQIAPKAKNDSQPDVQMREETGTPAPSKVTETTTDEGFENLK